MRAELPCDRAQVPPVEAPFAAAPIPISPAAGEIGRPLLLVAVLLAAAHLVGPWAAPLAFVRVFAGAIRQRR